MDQGLESRAVDLEHLVEAVDRRVGGDRAGDRAAGGDGGQQQRGVRVEAQQVGDGVGGVLGQGVLAEDGGGGEGDREAGGVGDLLPGEVLARLRLDGGGGQELTGGGVELGVDHG
ncbi:hypothetical protein GCM10009566_55810 [Streptomyces murinus]